MEAIIKESSLKQSVTREPAWSEAIRFERYCLLDEIPGLVFGLLAIVYLVTSLLAFA